MKSLRRFVRLTPVAPALLLLVFGCPCLAKTALVLVSKEKAQELGIMVRSKVSGADPIRVELEFKDEGKLKDAALFTLETRDGSKPHATALKNEAAEPDRVLVSATVDRAKLGHLTLQFNVPAGKNSYQYILPLKDFVEQTAAPKPTAPAPATPK